ncbi:MAG: metal-sulfur cluster assembly factor [Candidatus Aenigmarchaeota archaeon]|nr:metal-sulfur cluster assembly factor [Candidatus Aenigmarchaeota archaeon]
MPTKEQVLEALKIVVDPEIQIDIVTLGLIYRVDIDGNKIKITMTLTTPNCPYGPQLLNQVKSVAEKVEGVESTEINVVWEPPWQPSEELKAMLGIN